MAAVASSAAAMPDLTRFWEDALVFVRGSRHRDAATSPEAVAALPTAAAFLRKYSFEAVLAAVGAILAPADDAGELDDESADADDEDGDDALLGALSPTARGHFSTGCELLEKLVASPAVFSADGGGALLLATVLTASSIPASPLRRTAAAFYCRLARDEFAGAASHGALADGRDNSGSSGPAEAVASRIAAAREALWVPAADAAPGSAASIASAAPPHVAALCALLCDRDTVTAERAANALAALCGLAAAQRDSWEASAGRRVQRARRAAAGGAGAGAGAAVDSEVSAAPAGSTPVMASSSAAAAAMDDHIRGVAAGVAAALAATDDGDDGGAASAAGPFATQRSVRLVRVASLLANMLRPGESVEASFDEESRRDEAAGGGAAGSSTAASSSATAAAEAQAHARARRALAERVAAAFAAEGVIATVIDAAGDDSDVLTQLNILEALPALAATEVGARALLESGLMVGPLLEWAGIPPAPAAAAAAGSSGAAAATGPAPEGDPFLCTPALAALADTFAAVLAVSSAGSSSAASVEASAAAAGSAAGGGVTPSAVAALAQSLRRTLIPGVFAAVARECRGGGDVDAAVRAIAACATLLAADSGAVNTFLAPPQRLHAREWLENAVSATADLRTAALGGVAIVLEGAAAAVRRAGIAEPAGLPLSPTPSAASDDGSPAAGGAGAGAESGSPASPAVAAVAADAAAISPPVAVAADSAFRRYCDLFDRLGAECGRDTVVAAIATLKKVCYPLSPCRHRSLRDLEDNALFLHLLMLFCRHRVFPTHLTSLQPDGPSHLAAYRLLAAACALPASDGWGMRRVWGYTGAAAYLLDR